MKKLLAVFLSVGMCLSGMTVCAGAAAAREKDLYGDLNGDRKLSIDDVTALQRNLAELIRLDQTQQLLADYNHDDCISVKDATEIQRAVAELPQSKGCGGYLSYLKIDNCYPDYLINSMPAGTPVTFTAVSQDDVDEYEFWVDDKVVKPRSPGNTFTYTFPYSGSYQLLIRAYTYNSETGERAYGELYSGYRALSSPDDTVPRINRLRTEPAAETPSSYTVLYGATGGAAPYTYAPSIVFCKPGENEIARLTQYLAAHDTGWQLRYDDATKQCELFRDFSAAESVRIDKELMPLNRTGYSVYVRAKDAQGQLSNQEYLWFMPNQ